jgi:hypothetical protein
MQHGRTLKIFVMGREPRSLKSVELANWTGFAFIGGRQHVEQARQRKELNEPAIYMLLNEGSIDGGTVDIYIGETEDFLDRIQQHVRTKDWWTQFVVFVARDNNLTKAHVKYLEAEIYKLARNSIGTLVVKNGNIPPGASLPESDISTMNEFLENIIFVLESLGLSYFQNIDPNNEIARIASLQESNLHTNDFNTQRRESALIAADGMEFYISLPRDLAKSEEEALRSYMVVRNGSYVLKKGSLIRKTSTERFSDYNYYSLWKQITESDAVAPNDNTNLLLTTRDIEFTAPSAAGAIVRARSTNGRTEWKRISDDKPLNECEAQMLTDTNKSS